MGDRVHFSLNGISVGLRLRCHIFCLLSVIQGFHILRHFNNCTCVLCLEAPTQICGLSIGANGWLFKSHIGSGLPERSHSALQNGRSKLVVFEVDENLQ